MVKFSNKGKGKPSKRMDLKKKYKIQRKVREHNKKLRKQARSIKKKGLKHRKNQMSQAIPNLYPFKQQILQQFKNKLPVNKNDQIIQQLNAQKFGFRTQDNSSPYFPKIRGKNIKKYVNNLQSLIDWIDIALITIDPALFQLCRDKQIEQKISLEAHKIFILMKCQSLQEKNLNKQLQIIKSSGVTFVQFLNDQKHKSTNVDLIIKQINKINIKTDINLAILGKVNTGKNTLLKSFKKYLGISDDLPDNLHSIRIANNIKFLDSSYKIEDKTNFPLFKIPNYTQTFRISEQQQIVKKLAISSTQSSVPILNPQLISEYYQIMPYIGLTDLINKVGKMLRLFGKGGMVDAAKVRVKILNDWYSGKLNNTLSNI